MARDQWHLLIRKYSGTGPPEQIGERVRAGLLPILREQPEFRAYFAARIDGGGGVFSVTVFDDREALLAMNTRALDWARSSLSDLLTSPPEMTTADVKVHLHSARSGQDSYIMVRATEGLGPATGTLPTVQERLVPLTMEQPGFRHLYSGRDDAQEDRAIAVSVFTNRSTATAAHAQVAALMAQHRDLWPKPPRVLLAGEVLVSAVV
jgi:hypothetical protein